MNLVICQNQVLTIGSHFALCLIHLWCRISSETSTVPAMLCHFTTDKVRKSFHFWPLSFQPASCYLLGKVHKFTSCRHLEKEWKQQMRKKASNLHYLARLCKKKKCQLESWNLMDGVVYCPFFPFHKHHASVQEKSFCKGNEFRRCFAGTDLQDCPQLLEEYLNTFVTTLQPCTNKNNIISPLPPSGSDISGWNLPSVHQQK